MAFPASAIDQLRREPTRTPGWSGKLLMFSGTMLFLTVVAYVGLRFGYQPYLQGEIQAHERDEQKFSQEIPASVQAQIVQFYSQLSNIKILLGAHPVDSRLMEFLEAKTLPAIYFDRLTLNIATRELQLSGKARTLQDFGMQLGIYENDPAIEKVVLRSATADTNNIWSFDLSVFVTPNLLGQGTLITTGSSTTPTTVSTSTAGTSITTSTHP